MCDIIPFSGIEYAERKVIRAGEVLGELKALSLDDLRMMDLCKDETPISPVDSLLQLAWEFQELAEKLMKHNARVNAQEIYEGFKP